MSRYTYIVCYSSCCPYINYYLFIKYYSPLHVSSIKCSSSGGHSCIQAAYGTVTLYNSSWWPVDTQLEWAAYRQATRDSYREWQYHMLLVYNYVLLKMSTWWSKHVEENSILWINNNQCIKLVINVWSIHDARSENHWVMFLLCLFNCVVAVHLCIYVFVLVPWLASCCYAWKLINTIIIMIIIITVELGWNVTIGTGYFVSL